MNQYKDNFDPDQQVTLEEQIADKIFDLRDRIEITEEDAGGKARDILLYVVGELRPDLVADDAQAPESGNVLTWNQAGIPETREVAEALEHAKAQRYVKDFEWEVRHAGEETATDDWEGYPTLDQAVTAALPIWKRIGLTFEQAAVLAMDANLVLSTGAEIDQDEDEENDWTDDNEDEEAEDGEDA